MSKSKILPALAAALMFGVSVLPQAIPASACIAASANVTERRHGGLAGLLFQRPEAATPPHLHASMLQGPCD